MEPSLSYLPYSLVLFTPIPSISHSRSQLTRQLNMRERMTSAHLPLKSCNCCQKKLQLGIHSLFAYKLQFYDCLQIISNLEKPLTLYDPVFFLSMRIHSVVVILYASFFLNYIFMHILNKQSFSSLPFYYFAVFFPLLSMVIRRISRFFF